MNNNLAKRVVALLLVVALVGAALYALAAAR